MTAMNSAEIVEGFRNKVPAEVTEIKGRFVSLILESIRMSATVNVPSHLRPSKAYDSLRNKTAKSHTLTSRSRAVPTPEQAREAAEFLYNSYD